MIEVRGVTKRFGDYVALEDVSVGVESGSLTALLGPSGSGKSTLLRVIAGLEAPDSGEVFISGREATALAPQDRELLRHRRLAHPQQSGEFPHRILPLGQLAEDEQPVLVGEQLQELAHMLGRRFHVR